ncbi:hypothetical protein QYE76_030268 [Lolium multiflorum]|uniref:RNase H type-1 domain-containing protein n=1 Tax=Lolium multiflorum TaxID=4521 RepID=A0AAD8QQH2_LOLMU|nr:hypothetical protein QYE76_030268 [Lolium multiflorum]
MNFDGSKRLEGAGAGVILVSPEGDKLKYVLRMTFPNASNNEAEYEALIHGMKMAKACGATRLKIFGDSQLVAQQVMNQCDAVNESMIAYKEVYNELEKLFDGCEVAAAAGTRSKPEQEATPGSAAATRGILVLDNVAAHPAGDRRSPQAPSDPLLQPPVSSSPAVDDDARGPLTVGLHWEAKLMGRGAHTRMEPYVQTETYDLENGGSLVFERDLYLVSERLERPPPKFHGVRIHDTPTGEQQWMITADLKGSSEPPISERILFSFKACNWPDGLAHALQEGLARVCGQHIAALRGSRFAYFARHDTMGEPMAPSSHPVLMIHVQHLDFMLHETRKDLERTRVHNHRAQMTVAHHAEAIQMLAKDRKILRLQRAKKDATIRRLREKIRTLEVTVRTQQDQIQEMEEEGDDIQGGDDFLSDDNDFEDDEFTDEEDYEFLEAAEDGIIPIDVDEE